MGEVMLYKFIIDFKLNLNYYYNYILYVDEFKD